MYSAEGLLEFSRRTHQSFGKLMAHCRTLTSEEFNRKHVEFGIYSVKYQLHHAIGAQKYWIGVLEGRMDVDDDPDDQFSMDDMEAYRAEVVGLMAKYLGAASVKELTTARPMITWQQIEKTLIPAHVVMRTLTHMFQHQGQVIAMCRKMGKPVKPGLDYPILP
ncbi:MAG: DinB family protein [candidate division Zixibacteria bacterium]|nr:DinB family protein [candidate division Zixibacteria bacterium]